MAHYQNVVRQCYPARPLLDKPAVAPGETLHERSRPFGPATGRSVQATKSHVTLELFAAGGRRSLWKHQFTHDPRTVTIIGKNEFSDATARDAHFRQLLYVLWSVPILYYIPQDANVSQLPGVTAIE